MAQRKSVTVSITLTPRELRIIDLVCSGCVNKQIQAELGVSRTRLEQLLNVLYCKVGVPGSRIGLVVWAMRKKLYK